MNTCRETHRPGELAEYFELRRRVYRSHYPWLAAGFGYFEPSDARSHIMVVLGPGTAGRVVAGGRLTISYPPDADPLPLEKAGVRLSELSELRDLPLSRAPYAEISRLAVDPAYSADHETSFLLADRLCELAAFHGADTVFSICPDAPARLNRLHARRRGAGYLKFDRLPTVFGPDMWLCCFTGLLGCYRRLAA